MRLHEHLGSTMIYVTHDQVEGMILVNRIVSLHSGKSSLISRRLAPIAFPAITVLVFNIDDSFLPSVLREWLEKLRHRQKL